jgi:hypothetical protein
MAELFSRAALQKFREFTHLANLNQPDPRLGYDQNERDMRWPKNGSAENVNRVSASSSAPTGETQFQRANRELDRAGVSDRETMMRDKPSGFANTGGTASRDQTSGGEQQLRSVLEGLGLPPETVEKVLSAVPIGGGRANNMGGMPPTLTSEEPGMQAASTALKPNKYQSLMALLDALELEDEDEIDGEQPAPDEGTTMPRSSGGMTNGGGLEMDGEALKSLPMRKTPPPPVRLPAKDSMSFATGDAAIAERRRAVDRRLDRHLRDHGLRSEAHRSHALELGRQKRARMALDAASDGFEDFSRFCPGAARIDVL